MINLQKDLRSGDKVLKVSSRPGGGTRVIVKNDKNTEEIVDFDVYGKYVRRVENKLQPGTRTIAN